MKPLKSQRGVIPIIEVLLIVALVGVAAATVYVQQRNAKYGVNPPPFFSFHKKKATAKPAPAPAAATGTVFTTKEIGVKFTVTDDIKDLDYLIVTNSGITVAYFSTKSLESAGKDCTAKFGAIGAIELDNTATDAQGSPPSLVKMLGTKYFYYSHPQATCADDKPTQDLQTKQITSFRKALDSAEIAN